MTVDVPEWAGELATDLPYPVVFATVSGAHLKPICGPCPRRPTCPS